MVYFTNHYFYGGVIMVENEVKLDDKVYRILIIDDERDVLDALYMTLNRTKQFKSEIFLVEDGDTALTIMDDQEFDLILTDYKMPKMNGIELLKKAINKSPNQVRMLITGYSDINIAKDAINKAQVHNYIEKPWDDDELVLTIHEALKRKDDRESTKIIGIENVKKAIELVNEFQNDPLNFQLREKINDEKLMFEFDSVNEFNKFSFELKKFKNIHINDINVFENKYIITVSVNPKSIEEILMHNIRESK